MKSFHLKEFSDLKISNPNPSRNTRIYNTTTKHSELIYLLGKDFNTDLCQYVFLQLFKQNRYQKNYF